MQDYSILKHVKSFIAKNKLIEKNDKLILGISGGKDSCVLLDILFRLGYRPILAHCNFHLRAKESNLDAIFVRNLAYKYRLAFYETQFDTYNYANKHQISVEMAARELRYNWFNNLKQTISAQKIITAHHLQDSIETVLLNLTRGTGIHGLHGIKPKLSCIIRPMLEIKNNDINMYAQNYKIEYREDHTNNTTIYKRNKIRHNVLPVLKELNPAFEHTFFNNIQKFIKTENIYNDYIEDKKKEYITFDNKTCLINTQNLFNITALDMVLYEWIKIYNYNETDIKQIIKAIKNHSYGAMFYSFSHQLLVDRRFLIIKPKCLNDKNIFFINKDTKELYKPYFLKCKTILFSELLLKKIKENNNKNIVYFDFDKLIFPLTIRKYEEGDWFIPLGMKGKKKISKLLKDHKIDNFAKRSIYVVCSGDNIIWIPSFHTDNRYKITNNTKKIFNIAIVKNI